MEGGDDDLGKGCGKVKCENDGENLVGRSFFGGSVESEGKKSS